MKDEIKEILEDIDNKECYYVGTNGCLYQDITKEELMIIKDYITNLQEENEKVHKDFNELSEKYFFTKSRNEKAKSLTNRTIEVIKQQPSGNDEWILERLNGINYCLNGDDEE